MTDWVVSADHKTFVGILTSIRKAAGLTQRDMAAKLGRAHSIIAKIETGQRNVSVLEFMAWCRAAAVQPDVVIKQLEDAGL